MNYKPTREQLRGLSYETAKLYGMPHIGCHYIRDDVNATAWDDRIVRRCAVCGRVNGQQSKHHEPPKGKGSNFTLATPLGQFVLKPALIGLCGSGTTGCHGDRHNGTLSIRWEWDTEEDEEKWWNGYWLSRTFNEPHGKWLYWHGRYVFEKNGVSWEHREVT